MFLNNIKYENRQNKSEEWEVSGAPLDLELCADYRSSLSLGKVAELYTSTMST